MFVICLTQELQRGLYWICYKEFVVRLNYKVKPNRTTCMVVQFTTEISNDKHWLSLQDFYVATNM